MRRKRLERAEGVRYLPVLGLRERVILPLGVPSKSPLWAARTISINAVKKALASDEEVLLLTVKKMSEDPAQTEFYEVGTVATILEWLETKNGEIKIIVEGYARAVVLGVQYTDETLVAKVRVMPEREVEDSPELEAERRELLAAFEEYYRRTERRIDHDLQTELINETHPGQLADLIAFLCSHRDPNNISLTYQQLQQVLNTLDPVERMHLVTSMVKDLLEIIEIERNLQDQVKKQVERTQREYYLSEKLKAIQKELGRGEAADTEELRERVRAAKMDPEAEEKALKEIDRLEQMPPMSAEAGVIRSYVEWLLALPWNVRTEAKIDLDRAAQMLDEDHYGLEKVKERILEYLAVMKLVDRVRGPILCFVGPPGVGKTSLGKSIARATGRNFVRMSLGGVRDEAEIRGHRRTYIGSIPGRIIQGIRDAKSKNPLFLLDEVDKMSMDFRGDPAAALLEVLDPEQNSTFRDHYLDVPFDLSEVMFITTANILPAIPEPLRDRMEIIELPGYTEYEKRNIAKYHLVPKQIRQHGLESVALNITDKAIDRIITEYTREAGVRNLEREITKICRKVARDLVLRQEKGQKPPKRLTVGVRNLERYLGPPRFLQTKAESMDNVGVVQGLVYTAVGGDVIAIEATLMPALGTQGQLMLTGQLGEVMRESAQTALSYIRSRAQELGIGNFEFRKWDIHIHVPEGAVPKEGPSAGITLATAIYSAISGRRVRKDIAMTGEITLRGNVLAIGGLKEKLLAAHRVGIREVIIPKDNLKDLEDIPAEIRKDMRIHPVQRMLQVLNLALLPPERPQREDTVGEPIADVSMPPHLPSSPPPGS
ncbi:MAG: Lon protease [Candidatus Poribacteria bacterium]|nr:MAG: Lon protease [Candidatus Poribacteria bacterium]